MQGNLAILVEMVEANKDKIERLSNKSNNLRHHSGHRRKKFPT